MAWRARTPKKGVSYSSRASISPHNTNLYESPKVKKTEVGSDTKKATPRFKDGRLKGKHHVKLTKIASLINLLIHTV